MKDIRVSIGMPVHNGQTCVDTAIRSLLNQTMDSFELIISDNASTDGTREIYEQYSAIDSRVSYIRQRKNIGPTNNFRLVLEKAKAPYFMWAAHDDYWEPTLYRESVYRNPNAQRGIRVSDV